MASEQRLNSLDRFRKDPGRLVLEEHSHCEVPAGCGGVVLRWRNPATLLSVIVFGYHAGKGSWLFDGDELANGRVDLQPGRHVIACALDSVDYSSGLILFAAITEPPASASRRRDETDSPSFKVVSASDGSWKFALEEPPNGWALPSFEDGSWPALAEVTAPTFTGDEEGSYQARRCLPQGAVCLGLPEPVSPEAVDPLRNRLLRLGGKESAPGTGSIWIRKVFEVPDDSGGHSRS